MLRSVGDGDQTKIHQKSPPFSNAKSPDKFEEISTKVSRKAGKVRNHGSKAPLWLHGILSICTRLLRSSRNPSSLLQSSETLDGRNRAIVIAESLARVIAAIRIATCVGGHISPRNIEISPHRPLSVVLRFESRDWRSFV